MKKIFILFLFFNLITFLSNAQNDCTPVTITNVTHESAGNRLTWTPHTGINETVISQGGDFYEFNLMGNGVYSMGAYHRFIPEDLSAVNGGTLSQVVFAPTYPEGGRPGHTYTVQIYQGGVWGAPENRNPGTLIVSQELHNENLTFNQENTITLETPVTIDASQELWIGYFCTNIDSITGFYKYPIGGDYLPCKHEFGDIVCYQNNWIAYGSSTNFCIKGKVQTPDGATVNIYCNEAQVASNIAGTTYLHEQPEGERQCYRVEVNCVEGGVSPLSNEFCFSLSIGNYEQRGSFTVYPNPARNELSIVMNNEQLIMNNIEVFDVYGKKLSSHHLINTSSHHLDISALASGVYFVRLIGDKGYSVQRFVKE